MSLLLQTLAPNRISLLLWLRSLKVSMVRRVISLFLPVGLNIVVFAGTAIVHVHLRGPLCK